MGASYRAVFVGCSCQAFGSARLILALRAAYSTCGWWLRHAASGDVPVGAFRGGQAAKRPGGQAAIRLSRDERSGAQVSGQYPITIVWAVDRVSDASSARNELIFTWRSCP